MKGFLITSMQADHVTLCTEDKIECDAGLPKAFYHRYALISGQPHICELCTEDRLDLECEAGPLNAFLLLVCTDSRPASHWNGTYRQ